MIGSVAAVLALVAAGLALSAWSVKMRRSRGRPDNPASAPVEEQPSIADIVTHPRVNQHAGEQ